LRRSGVHAGAALRDISEGGPRRADVTILSGIPPLKGLRNKNICAGETVGFNSDCSPFQCELTGTRGLRREENRSGKNQVSDSEQSVFLKAYVVLGRLDPPGRWLMSLEIQGGLFWGSTRSFCGPSRRVV
ncbi:hypothetical protein XENOCAPTIV_030680, partial [Xenoophorus captivus]